eukprot:1162118-Pelagomonas_calceolata.AAC.8
MSTSMRPQMRGKAIGLAVRLLFTDVRCSIGKWQALVNDRMLEQVSKQQAVAMHCSVIALSMLSLLKKYEDCILLWEAQVGGQATVIGSEVRGLSTSLAGLAGRGARCEKPQLLCLFAAFLEHGTGNSSEVHEVAGEQAAGSSSEVYRPRANGALGRCFLVPMVHPGANGASGANGVLAGCSCPPHVFCSYQTLVLRFAEACKFRAESAGCWQGPITLTLRMPQLTAVADCACAGRTQSSPVSWGHDAGDAPRQQAHVAALPPHTHPTCMRCVRYGMPVGVRVRALKAFGMETEHYRRPWSTWLFFAVLHYRSCACAGMMPMMHQKAWPTWQHTLPPLHRCTDTVEWCCACAGMMPVLHQKT